MAKYQVAFGMMNSASRSFIYGPSTANVVARIVTVVCCVIFMFPQKRIEAWWAQLRKFKTEWWIDTCKVSLGSCGRLEIKILVLQSLVSEGHFSKSNLIHR